MAQSEGLLSKGIELGYGDTVTSGSPVYTVADDLLEIPDIGGTTDSVEVTTLKDDAHRYINGLKDYGDSLDFVFLYTKSQFEIFDGFGDTVKAWQVKVPTETSGTMATCSFTGPCSIKYNGVAANDAEKMTLSIKPNSSMLWA